MGQKADQKGRIPYVNPVRCLNFVGGHNYEHKFRVNISAGKVDPHSGEMLGEVEKEYMKGQLSIFQVSKFLPKHF